MNLQNLFDVFSRRTPKSPAAPRKPLTRTFRNRVLMLCRDNFTVPYGYGGAPGDYTQELWHETHRRLAYLLGRPRLSNNPSDSRIEDVLLFLAECSDEHFLDFIEGIFQVDVYFHASPKENVMVEEINQLFLLEDLPYAITPFIRETRTEQLFGGAREVSVLVSYPKVVLREDQALHAEAVAPTIQLLADSGFSSANQEFLAALDDYRKGRYGDCLTKCGSAFESTMKLICARRDWAYQPTDTAGELLRVVRAKFRDGCLLRATLAAHRYNAQPPQLVPRRRCASACRAAAQGEIRHQRHRCGDPPTGRGVCVNRGDLPLLRHDRGAGPGKMRLREYERAIPKLGCYRNGEGLDMQICIT